MHRIVESLRLDLAFEIKKQGFTDFATVVQIAKKVEAVILESANAVNNIQDKTGSNVSFESLMPILSEQAEKFTILNEKLYILSFPNNTQDNISNAFFYVSKNADHAKILNSVGSMKIQSRLTMQMLINSLIKPILQLVNISMYQPSHISVKTFLCKQ